MYSKDEQLSKNRKQNKKKLTASEDRRFRETIRNCIAGDRCQLCGDSASDIHHPEFGRMGADRNMKCALLVCSSCHSECHKLKHGDKNKKYLDLDTEWTINKSHIMRGRWNLKDI